MRLVKIILLMVLPVSGFCQQLVHIFVFDSATYWMQQQDGKMGLLKGTEQLVPYRYDAVFPSVTPGFSFVVKNNAIGVYDHKSQTELILTEEYPEIRLQTDWEGGCLLQLLGEKYGAHNILNEMLFERQSDGELIKTEEGKFTTPRRPKHGVYKNGIQRVDDDHYLHHATEIAWEEVYGDDIGEEMVQYRFTKALQQSGIYSLVKQKFVVDPSFAKVDIRMARPAISKLDQFIELSQYDLNEMIDDSWQDDIVEDPAGLLHYALVNAHTLEVVMRPQPQRLYTSVNGGFFKAPDLQMKLLEVYDANGTLQFRLPNVDEYVDNVLLTDKHALVGFNSGNYDQFETMVPDFKIYDLKGNYLKPESMIMWESDIDLNLKRAITGKLSEPYGKLTWGLYDLEKLEYLLPPIYQRISTMRFSDGLLKCPNQNCSEYYKVRAGDNTTFLTHDLNEFKPEWIIEQPFEEINYDELDFWNEPNDYDRYSYRLNDSNEVTKFFEGVEVINLGSYPASIAESWNGMSIVKREIEHSEPLYGLLLNGQSDFLLPPVFEEMRFEKTDKSLFVKLGDQSGSVLLKRYEK